MKHIKHAKHVKHMKHVKHPMYSKHPKALESLEELKALKTLKALNSFQSLLEKFRRQALEQPQQLHNTCRQMIEEINYEGEIRKQYKEELQQAARVEMLEMLIDAIGEYTNRADRPSLDGFLEEAAP